MKVPNNYAVSHEFLSFAEQDSMQKMYHGWEEQNISQLSMPDPMVLEKEQKQSKTLYLSDISVSLLYYFRVGYNVKKKLQGMDVYKVSYCICCVVVG